MLVRATKYRSDIDGLRALAVLAVVAFHAFPDWVRGGFIGVDVFFVISGYLISKIIFKNLDRGTFSFTEFYFHRVKRIFPALLLILLICFAFGWFALIASEYKQLGKHIAGGAGFVSNFVLWSEVGYFDNLADTKPLLHLWSLGVEGQFYIVWPILLWFAWRYKFNLLTITIVIIIASFILNIKGIKQDTVATFYSPQTRFWELLSGSLLAWIALYKGSAFLSFKDNLDVWLSRIVYSEKSDTDGKTLANILSSIGMLLLAYGFWRVNKELRFPGIWALIPVLGTALIITAGSKAWINYTFLSNRLAVWFGLISYPLYLWHWPILSFARIIEGEVPSHSIRMMAVVLSVACAWLTYKFVELPLCIQKYNKVKVTLLLVLLLIVGCIGYNAYARDGLSFRKVEKLFAINSTAFYAKNETPGDNCKILARKEYVGQCSESNKSMASDSIDIFFLGDSHGQALYSGWDFEGKNTISLGQMGCLPFIGVDRFTKDGPKYCQKSYRPAINFIDEKSSPNSTVLLIARYANYVEGTGYGVEEEKLQGNMHIQAPGRRVEKSKNLTNETFYNGLVNTLNILSTPSRKIILVFQVPELGFDPKSCILRPFQSKVHECVVERKAVLARQENYRRLILKAVDNFKNTIIYDPIDIFCDPINCRPIKNGLMLYRDGDHVNITGAREILGDMKKKGYIP